MTRKTKLTAIRGGAQPDEASIQLRGMSGGRVLFVAREHETVAEVELSRASAIALAACLIDLAGEE